MITSQAVYCGVKMMPARRNDWYSAFFWLIPALFLSAFSAHAQYGQEWIDYTKEYYRIPVGEDGIYRITYQDLQNAGFPVGAVDPRRIQLYHRGVEQAVHVEGQADAQFNTTDFIEFFGRKNDGESDTELYQPVSAQPHTYYNLFSDTTAYFLTVNALAVAGKRMDRKWEVNVSGLPAEPFHMDEKMLVNTQEASLGQAYATYIRNTFFDVGEGWTGQVIAQNNSVDYTLEGLTNGMITGGLPKLEMLIVGRADIVEPHRVEIYAGPSAGMTRLITTRDIEKFNTVQIKESLNWTDIGGDGRLVVRMRVLAVGTSARASISYIRVTYPQQFSSASVSEKYFRLAENPGGKSFISILNPPANARLYDVTQPDAVSWYVPPASTFNPVISSTESSRRLLLTSIIRPVSNIKRIRFRNIQPTRHNYIIISHRSLMTPAGEHTDIVRAFAGYRSSPAGGKYDTLVLDVRQLYDQFNYGEISPLAIHRFMKFMVDGGNPRYLFIIGKGLDWNLGYYRNPSNSRFTVYKDLVPSAGSPASDLYYTIGLGSTTYEPAIATGRLSAMQPAEVLAYLNKVKETEALPYTELWRKRIMHLSGGITNAELQDFKRYMRDFSFIAENIFLGGETRLKSKNSIAVGEVINISEEVNNGVSLITFFGHSSPTNADFEVGFVSNPSMGYRNAGRYPVFLINGCNVGDFFSTGPRFGEDWTNAHDKGAIGFIAHSYFGYTTTLRYYSDLFYRVAFADSSFMQQGLGDIQKEVARRYMQFLSPTELNLTQVSQMVLLGDPAVRLFGAGKPDYTITKERVFISSRDGQPVTGFSDAFTVNMVVQNPGMAIPDSLRVRITRVFDDGSTEAYDSLFRPVFFQDTLQFIIRQAANKGFGNNTLRIELDPENTIDELTETNNAVEYDLFIPRSVTQNLLPYNFAIVNTPSVKLKFASSDVAGAARDFIVELDTVPTFDSPQQQQAVINGRLIEYPVDLLTADSTVYYWRTRFKDPSPTEVADWSVSSFSFIANGPEGWAQLRFPQFLANRSSGLVMDPQLERIGFETKTITVSVNTYGSNYSLPGKLLSVKVNNEEYAPADVEVICRNNTLNLLAFDKQSLIPYAGLMAVPACGRRPLVINSFTFGEIQTNIQAYLENIAWGDSLVMFTYGNPDLAALPALIKLHFESAGISEAQLSSILPGEPVVIFARKGAAPGTARLIRSDNNPADTQELAASGTITGSVFTASMNTPVIGPAQRWNKLNLRVLISEFPQTDKFSIDVTGITLSGDAAFLFREDSAEIDLSSIAPEQYPYLALTYTVQDSVNLTPPQLLHWIVDYTPVAEGVLQVDVPQGNQQVMEGETWSAVYRFLNISNKNFTDSLTVRYGLTGLVSRKSTNQSIRIQAPAPDASISFTLPYVTLGQVGLNDAWVNVNPRIIPEQYYDNNQVVFSGLVRVEPDVTRPVLEVTVDGRFLLNGDYVAPNPHIRIVVRDENPFLKIVNPESVTVRLRYPNSAFPTLIQHTQADVQWRAQTETEPFTLDFKPVNLLPGTYELEVEARDASNNASSTEPYRITFVVAYETYVVFMPPHPNPSNDQFWFDLSIAGVSPPDKISVTVLALDGRKVKQFDVTDMIIGLNRFSWDGTDFSGNNLPGGLYLYNLVITKEGETLPVNLPEGEKFFTGGYGKLVLSR
jgi:hypothetical protein